MATQNLPYYVIVNNPSSTAADTAAVSGGDAILKDGAGNEVYRFKTSKGVSGETRLGLIESAKVGTFTVASVSADDVFSFFISQDVDEAGGDGLLQVLVSYKAVSGDTGFEGHCKRSRSVEGYSNKCCWCSYSNC
jgi:hypothetical protein